MFDKQQLIMEMLDNEYDALDEKSDEEIFDLYANILLGTYNFSSQEKEGIKSLQ